MLIFSQSFVMLVITSPRMCLASILNSSLMNRNENCFLEDSGDSGILFDCTLININLKGFFLT